MRTDLGCFARLILQPYYLISFVTSLYRCRPKEGLQDEG